jgi:hypothetical protein
MRCTYFQSLKFALLGCEFTPPSSIGFTIRLDARFELVDLLPPRIKLPPHISKFLGKLCLRFLDAFVNVELDLRESFEPGDQVVVEDAEIGEWLRFSLMTLLL